MRDIKEIVCPCGNLLVRTPGGGSGLKTCTKCGQMVHFDISEDGVRLRLEDREALMLRRPPQTEVSEQDPF